ncbi:metallophosphoesterase [Candidatus Woesearchaeota archaeon]|nr:metallophosphoesterase [Candidatus Woesearchaeota archaeon]
MKILAFVDMHGSLTALKKIKKRSAKADLIVCAGDLTIFGQGTNYFLEKLSKLNKPILMIHGNHEEETELKKICSKFKNITFLHARGYKENGYFFLGYGGGGFSMRDKGFEKLSKQFGERIKKLGNPKTILITHAPPYKTKVDLIMEEPCGNKSIKNFIKKTNSIILVISGHLHENAGKEDKINDTRIINPGPYGKIISI